MKKFLLTLAAVLAFIPAFADKYVLVTDASKLAANKNILIVAQPTGGSYALSTTQNNSNRGAVAITVTNNEITEIPKTAQVITLEGETGSWNFNVGNGNYLYASSNSSNQLKTQNKVDANATASITIDDKGVASVVFQRTSGRNTLQFNPNNGNPLFACYASASQTAVKIFMAEEEIVTEDPTLAVNEKTIDFGSILAGTTAPAQTVKVTAANLDAAPTYTWATGGIFNAEGTLTTEGGNLSITLAATAEGKYQDVLTITAGELTATVNVYAKIISLAGEGDGTQTNPYNVARALDILANELQSTTEVYIAGIVSEVTEISTQYGNATYNISDNGVNDNFIVVYRGYYLNNAKFTAEDQLAVADEVVVLGKLVNYVKGGIKTPEVGQNNYLVSLTRNGNVPAKELGDITITGVTNGATVFEGTEVTIAAENAESISYTLNGGAAVNVEGASVTITLAIGDTSLAAVATLGETTKTLETINFTVVEKTTATTYTAVLYGKNYNNTDDVKAADVTFAVKEPASSANATWEIKDVVTVTASAAAAYNEIRVYKKASLEFTPATGVTITKITFNTTASNYTNLTGTGLSFDGLVGTWEGEATSKISFNSTEQTRLKTIVVEFESASFVPGVKKEESTVTFTEEEITVALNSDFAGQVATCSVDGATLVYTSDNTTVAEVDAATGAVTLKAVGEANITAKFEGDDNYYSSEASYKLIVTKAVIEGDNTYSSNFDDIKAADITNGKTFVAGNAAWTVGLTNIDGDAYTGVNSGVLQFGSSNNGIDEVVLASESFEGYSIKAISLTGRTSSTTATLSFYVGNEVVKTFDLTSSTQNADYDWVAEAPIADADAIKIVYKQGSDAKAFFVKNITVVYDNPALPESLSSRHFRTFINGEETSIWNVQLKSGDKLKIRTIPGLKLYYKYAEVSPTDPSFAPRYAESVDGTIDPETEGYTLHGSNVFNITVPEFENDNTHKYDFVLVHPTNNDQLIRELSIYKDGMTGVENVEADNSEAAVEYFNLQGQRVNEPANGIFIRRQGSKVTKVIVK